MVDTTVNPATAVAVTLVAPTKAPKACKPLAIPGILNPLTAPELDTAAKEAKTPEIAPTLADNKPFEVLIIYLHFLNKTLLKS
jgi:hypothetical protein